ncbi:MAG: CAP domain-containing protein [Geobacteraceae bacterium]|nr:CAP domain-containing protein [Geobacteraceae bacterium]
MKSAVRPLAAIIVFLVLSVQIAAASSFEDELLVLINRYRQSKKLKPLVSSPQYAELAREHSRTMQEQDRMSHDGFDDRFRRASDASSCVENVAWNHQTPQSLFNGWRTSPGHNRNMLDRKIRRVGLDRSGAYATFFACY